MNARPLRAVEQEDPPCCPRPCEPSPKPCCRKQPGARADIRFQSAAGCRSPCRSRVSMARSGTRRLSPRRPFMRTSRGKGRPGKPEAAFVVSGFQVGRRVGWAPPRWSSKQSTRRDGVGRTPPQADPFELAPARREWAGSSERTSAYGVNQTQLFARVSRGS